LLSKLIMTRSPFNTDMLDVEAMRRKHTPGTANIATDLAHDLVQSYLHLGGLDVYNFTIADHFVTSISEDKELDKQAFLDGVMRGIGKSEEHHQAYVDFLISPLANLLSEGGLEELTIHFGDNQEIEHAGFGLSGQVGKPNAFNLVLPYNDNHYPAVGHDTQYCRITAGGTMGSVGNNSQHSDFYLLNLPVWTVGSGSSNCKIYMDDVQNVNHWVINDGRIEAHFEFSRGIRDSMWLPSDFYKSGNQLLIPDGISDWKPVHPTDNL